MYTVIGKIVEALHKQNVKLLNDPDLSLRFRLRSPKLLFKYKFAHVHHIKRRNSINHQRMAGPEGHYANKTCQICQREEM